MAQFHFLEKRRSFILGNRCSFETVQAYQIWATWPALSSEWRQCDGLAQSLGARAQFDSARKSF